MRQDRSRRISGRKHCSSSRTDDASSRARLLYIRLCPLQATSVFWAFRSLADRGLAKAIASRFGSRLVSVVPIAESVCSMVHVAMHLDSRGQR
jgi:hypothetical protein